LIEFNGKDLPVCFQVLFEDAVVFYASVLDNQQPVQEKIRDDSIPFVFL